MLAAVDLDDEAAFDAAEIDHVSPDRPLALELESAEPAIAQFKPHCSLSVGHLPSQSFGVGTDGAHGTFCPHPTRSRKRERAY
jgi:hypothetical protein